LLIDEQIEVAAFLLYCRPNEIGLSSTRWNSAKVKFVIEYVFEIEVSRSYVKRLLLKCGLSYKKGEKRHFKRDEARIHTWRTTIAPLLLMDAKEDCEVVYFLDESRIYADQSSYYSWSIKGEVDFIPQGISYRTNAIAAISLMGEPCAMTIDSAIDSYVIIQFLLQILKKNRGRKVVVFLDGAAMHKSEELEEWLDEHPNIRLEHLPPYAPELNPVELLWSSLKNDGSYVNPEQSVDSFRNSVDADLRLILSNKDLVLSFFQKKSTRYTMAA
jgi:transposase